MGEGQVNLAVEMGSRLPLELEKEKVASNDADHITLLCSASAMKIWTAISHSPTPEYASMAYLSHIHHIH